MKGKSRAATSSSKWEYKCIYCSQSFYSGRALGGHQNAHRFETREKQRTHHLRIPLRDHPPSPPTLGHAAAPVAWPRSDEHSILSIAGLDVLAHPHHLGGMPINQFMTPQSLPALSGFQVTSMAAAKHSYCQFPETPFSQHALDFDNSSTACLVEDPNSSKWTPEIDLELKL